MIAVGIPKPHTSPLLPFYQQAFPNRSESSQGFFPLLAYLYEAAKTDPKAWHLLVPRVGPTMRLLYYTWFYRQVIVLGVLLCTLLWLVVPAKTLDSVVRYDSLMTSEMEPFEVREPDTKESLSRQEKLDRRAAEFDGVRLYLTAESCIFTGTSDEFAKPIDVARGPSIELFFEEAGDFGDCPENGSASQSYMAAFMKRYPNFSFPQ